MADGALAIQFVSLLASCSELPIFVDIAPAADGAWTRYFSRVSRTGSAISAGSSSMANITVRSNPCGPVISTRKPPLNESAAIHASCGARRVPAASDHGRLDAFTSATGYPFDVKDG